MKPNNNSRMVSASWNQDQNSARHTPGPWKLQSCDNAIYSTKVVAEGNDLICRAHYPDACLIAAAPELLEALQALHSIEHRINAPQKIFDKMHAAIAKATGVTNPCPTCGGEGNCPDCEN